ncbi:hypothetical protein B0A54_17868 [Friedmanniomyces endolithicus]|uniref:Uncharacterized protein n=1 Tax=Friedmanniomyces endolithicus TaxID=329885 RepID=A0A4U0TMJ6_9PEZI|nr:hypothetical protein LTS09_018180 [Friedmanniomyces endolithicus]TKA23180.1 hypothetical protein B0A54_17868 [Friedmanniomyces endolithicus]
MPKKSFSGRGMEDYHPIQNKFKASRMIPAAPCRPSRGRLYRRMKDTSVEVISEREKALMQEYECEPFSVRMNKDLAKRSKEEAARKYQYEIALRYEEESAKRCEKKAATYRAGWSQPINTRFDSKPEKRNQAD